MPRAGPAKVSNFRPMLLSKIKPVVTVGKGNALCQWPVAIRGVGATIESEGNAIHVRQILVLGQRSRQRRSQYGETGADSARGQASAFRATNAGLGPGSYLTLWSSNGGQSSNC